MDEEVLRWDQRVSTPRIGCTRSVNTELVPGYDSFSFYIEKESDHDALECNKQPCRLEGEGVELASYENKQHEMWAHYDLREIFQTRSRSYEEKANELRNQ